MLPPHYNYAEKFWHNVTRDGYKIMKLSLSMSSSASDITTSSITTSAIYEHNIYFSFPYTILLSRLSTISCKMITTTISAIIFLIRFDSFQIHIFLLLFLTTSPVISFISYTKNHTRSWDTASRSIRQTTLIFRKIAYRNKINRENCTGTLNVSFL